MQIESKPSVKQNFEKSSERFRRTVDTEPASVRKGVSSRQSTSFAAEPRPTHVRHKYGKMSQSALRSNRRSTGSRGSDQTSWRTDANLFRSIAPIRVGQRSALVHAGTALPGVTTGENELQGTREPGPA
jgi:hypothetical protein